LNASDNGNTKGIAILGSTGSIGVQALEVLALAPERFRVEVLTAQRNADLLIAQALAHNPNAVVIADESLYPKVKEALAHTFVKVYTRAKALEEVVSMDGIDIVLTALVGFAGLYPTLAALRARKTIALANKETLVVGGHLVTQLAEEMGVNIYPVDSEHSALFQ
jgi:1-deoxy-D-xylulose-5-phosphate reductoisomerase